MWAMQAQSLTAEQCRELLRVAKDRMVQVKIHNKDIRTTPGRARLVCVCDNNRQAIVKPHHHGKNETVELTQISYWVGGNSHFPEGTEIMKQSFQASGLSNAAGGLAPVHSPHYVVSDSLNSVWGGSVNQWVSIPRNAHEFPNLGDASRSIYRLKSRADAQDARAVTKAEMQTLVGGWMSEKPQPAAPRGEGTLMAPKLIVESDPPVESMYSTIEPRYPSQKNNSTNLEFNLDEIAKDDGDTLQKAFQERRRAAQDALEAQTLLEEALVRLRASTAVIQTHIGKTATAPVVDEKKGNVPKGTVRAAIRKILGESSRLSTSLLVEKVQGLGVNSTPGSIKQAIYSMRQTGLLESNDNGHALTAAGRK